MSATESLRRSWCAYSWIEEEKPTKLPNQRRSVKKSGLDAFSLMEDKSDYAVSMADAVRESDNIFRRSAGEELLGEEQEVSADNVSHMNFEDEYFRLSDEMNYRFDQDNVDEGLHEGPIRSAEATTFVDQKDMKKYFDRILEVDPNAVLTEAEQKMLSMEREDVKEEEKKVKRNTWFSFMPAKEMPEGMLGSYSHDQIFSSLEWDLLSRNASEVYKYEKDDMLLNEVGVERGSEH